MPPQRLFSDQRFKDGISEVFIRKPTIYQDRLGTNARKIEQNTMVGHSPKSKSIQG